MKFVSWYGLWQTPGWPGPASRPSAAVRVHRDAVGTGERPEVVIERPVLQHDEDQVVQVHDPGLRIDRPTGIVGAAGAGGSSSVDMSTPFGARSAFGSEASPGAPRMSVGLGIGRVRCDGGGAGRPAAARRGRTVDTGSSRPVHAIATSAASTNTPTFGRTCAACGTLGSGMERVMLPGAVRSRDFTGSGPAGTDRSASATSRTPSRGSRAPGPRGPSDGCPASPVVPVEPAAVQRSGPRSASGRRRS